MYQTGCKLILACAVCQIVCAGGIRVLLVRRNKRREMSSTTSSTIGGGGEGEGVMEDLTDFEVCVFFFFLPLWVCVVCEADGGVESEV